MRLIRIVLVLLAALVLGSPPASAQSDRDATREKLRQVLTTAGQRSDVNVTFRQSTKNPYNFVGSMTDRDEEMPSRWRSSSASPRAIRSAFAFTRTTKAGTSTSARCATRTG